MTITKVFEYYFKENRSNLVEEKLFILRQDGIVLFSNFKDGLESTGALAAGVWQAASVLNQSTKSNSKATDFRLSFDKPDEGLYLVPLEDEKNYYLLCCVYAGVKNPGKLKMSLRKLKGELVKYIKNYKVTATTGEFLFRDISDDEMDRLFAGGAI